MRLSGFIGPAYQLDSVNVESQRCVNLYPEIIESGRGKEGRTVYLKSTPGLERLVEVGDGPIRCIHVDSIGRIFVVSGNKLYRISRRSDWKFEIYVPLSIQGTTVLQSSDINTATDIISTGNSFYTGQKVRVSSSDTLPAGLLEDTDYWIIAIDSSSFKMATTYANAVSGAAIDFSNTGTGNMTVTPQDPSSKLELDFDDVDFAANSFSLSSHGLYEGLRVLVTSIGTPLPTGLDFENFYYVIKDDDNTFRLASSPANVVADTEIDLSDINNNGFVAETLKTHQFHTHSSAQLGDEATFSTSTGVIKAASMSLGGDGEDSTTIFVDGTDRYAVFDPDQISGDFGVSFDSLNNYGDLGVDQKPTTHVVWIDGYFIVNDLGTNKFWVSGLQNVNIDALSFASSEGNPDLVQALIDNHRDLWIFNEKTTEIFVNTGNADFPFERVQGGFIEVGCLAKYSVAKIDGTIFWLGRSESGQGVVYSASGFRPQRVSTHAIEQAIAGYSSPEAATAFTYEWKGHKFYVLNFQEATWVYDLSTGLWHQRAYSNNGTLERHRAEVHAFDPGSGLHLVGDYESNKVYAFKDSVKSDDGTEITRLRAAPHLSADLNRIFYHKFQLDMETGIGLDGGVQGSDPTVMLDWSDDGGHTWSSERFALADAGGGQIGDYKKRVIWRRLGSSRDRVFRVKITDPVDVTLIGAHIDIERGAS